MSATERSDATMAELLPTGTVTLLLADVEGSTQLWEKQQEVMTAAIALLNRTVDQLVAAHGGVRPVEHARVTASWPPSRAADAVACALDLQRAELTPIRLRFGVHTGDVQLRDEGNYAGRRSTRPHGCAIWRTVARRCCRGLPRIWSKTSFPTMPG
jgi:class 3 adenylate cyclase